MIVRAFDKDQGATKIYAFEVSRKEIESCSFNEKDQEFFQLCANGSPSKQLLGLSLLAKKIEEVAAATEAEELLKKAPPKLDFGRN